MLVEMYNGYRTTAWVSNGTVECFLCRGKVERGTHYTRHSAAAPTLQRELVFVACSSCAPFRQVKPIHDRDTEKVKAVGHAA